MNWLFPLRYYKNKAIRAILHQGTKGFRKMSDRLTVSFCTWYCNLTINLFISLLVCFRIKTSTCLHLISVMKHAKLYQHIRVSSALSKLTLACLAYQNVKRRKLKYASDCCAITSQC